METDSVAAMHVDAAKWGVDLQYEDVLHQVRVAPPATVEAILRSMGAVTDGPESALAGPLVITQGDATAVDGEWHVALEDGGNRYGSRMLPRDLPMGYHRLTTHTGERSLIVAPDSATPYDGVRMWGWAVQLYAARSRSSWGMGDLGDLARLGEVAKRSGAGFVLLNPLHATIPGEPQQTSPYFPSSREFRNPLYIDVTSVPGFTGGVDVVADENGVAPTNVLLTARELNSSPRIDRNAIWRVKIAVLESLWDRFDKQDAAFTSYVDGQGESLRRYATYCVLSEQHGVPWSTWPASYRHPSSAVVGVFAKDHAERIAFHQWLQWLLAIQLHDAGDQVSLITDLAIGVDPAGADAWIWQDAFALDMRVGAPPDEFNQRGQDWGLPPFDPWRLRALNYEPFVHTIRAGLSSAGGLRIDHVMGLFRLYWIPEGMSARDGTYVRYPWRDLLSILCLESVRAGALVVGEDLGTVEPYMRDELAARNIASYKLLWFEEDEPKEYPHRSLAAITTHDLPTVAGLWSGSDLEVQEHLGMQPNIESTLAIRDRVKAMAGLEDGDATDQAVDACHRLLAAASSAMVSVTLEDALRLSERPNYPGTTDEYPNWSVPLPQFIEDFGDNPGFRATTRVMDDGRTLMPYHDSHDPA